MLSRLADIVLKHLLVEVSHSLTVASNDPVCDLINDQLMFSDITVRAEGQPFCGFITCDNFSIIKLERADSLVVTLKCSCAFAGPHVPYWRKREHKLNSKQIGTPLSSKRC